MLILEKYFEFQKLCRKCVWKNLVIYIGLAVYINVFEFIKEDLSKITTEKPVIVEGAAILPELILLNKIDSNNYICIVPTKEFQREKYSQRMWVKDYLSGCTDPEKAFNNWMDRDINFALKVKNKNYKHVKIHFNL